MTQAENLVAEQSLDLSLELSSPFLGGGDDSVHPEEISTTDDSTQVHGILHNFKKCMTLPLVPYHTTAIIDL